MKNKKRFELSYTQKFGLTLATMVTVAMAGLYALHKLDGRDIFKEANYQTYAGEARENKFYRKLLLRDARDEKRSGSSCIVAQDFNNDGRFDDIRLFGVPKGNSLEQYVNLEKLEDAYQAIINTNHNH